MKKGIIIGIIIVIVGIGVFASIELEDPSSTNTEPSEIIPITDEPEVIEEVKTGKSIQINLSDGIGAGDR